MCWVGTFRSSVPRENKYSSGMSLVTRQGSATASFWPCGGAGQRCAPSPKGWDTPVPQEGCPSTQCSLQAEGTGTQNSNVTLALGAWTWGGMAQSFTSLPWQPPALPWLALWGKAGKSAAAGWKQAAPSQSYPALAQTSTSVSGGWKGTGSAGQPWKEEEAVGPSCSPECWCYIYPTAGLGFGLSPVTQALQPARI